jgi:hypothetical protein
VPRQECHHLRAGLQDRHVGVEVDPVQALDIQRDMPVEHIVHRDDPLHHSTSVRSSRRSRDPEARLGPMPSHPRYLHGCTQANRTLGGPRLASVVLQPDFAIFIVAFLAAGSGWFWRGARAGGAGRSIGAGARCLALAG